MVLPCPEVCLSIKHIFIKAAIDAAMIKVLFIYCIQFPCNGEAAGAILIQINIEYKHQGAVKINIKVINADILRGFIFTVSLLWS